MPIYFHLFNVENSKKSNVKKEFDGTFFLIIKIEQPFLD